MTPLVASQAYLPTSVTVFENRNGTAPALLGEARRGGKPRWILVLPGPPRELIPLFEEALPALIERTGVRPDHFLIRSVKLAELFESQVAEKTTDLLRLKPPLTVGIYAKPGEVELKIMAKSTDRSEALRLADEIEKKIRRRFGTRVYGVDDETLSSVVGTLLRKNGKTLAAAESCTGGLFGGLVTDAAGSSDYFTGGVVAYRNDVKRKFLGVPAKILERHGAVSRETAERMALGARKHFGADYGVGITGVAGPSGGTPEKPVGLVHFAVARGSRIVRWEKSIFFDRSRADIRSRAAHKALDLLRLTLLGEKRGR